MKALKHLANRFSYAWNGSKKINVTRDDVEAINTLIREEKEKKRNTDLEDSLILFYLLAAYKVQNEHNKAKLVKLKPESIRFPMGMPEASTILGRLSKLINPKHEIIRMIADELWIYQEYERIPKDKELYMKEVHDIDITKDVQEDVQKKVADLQNWNKDGNFSTLNVTDQEMVPIPKEERITFEQVEELLNKALEYAKDQFPMFNALDKDFIKFIETQPLNSNKEKND